MTVNLELPNKKEIENGIKLAACAVGGVVAVKLLAKALDRAHERKQNKEIKKLKKQVAELEQKVVALEEEQKKQAKHSK